MALGGVALNLSLRVVTLFSYTFHKGCCSDTRAALHLLDVHFVFHTHLCHVPAVETDTLQDREHTRPLKLTPTVQCFYFWVVDEMPLGANV